jgi:hypothetical protein
LIIFIISFRFDIADDIAAAYSAAAISISSSLPASFSLLLADCFFFATHASGFAAGLLYASFVLFGFSFTAFFFDASSLITSSSIYC